MVAFCRCLGDEIEAGATPQDAKTINEGVRKYGTEFTPSSEFQPRYKELLDEAGYTCLSKINY